MKYIQSLLIITLLFSCQNIDNQSVSTNSNEIKTTVFNSKKPLINPEGKTIESRFSTPENFKRKESEANSFADYLRKLPLKPDGSKVLFHNGISKPNHGVYDAVVNLPIGEKNLHQCADAIMRLRAEYLWNHRKFDKIHFNFTNGWRVDYSKWIDGYRVKVEGNKTSWVKRSEPSNSYNSFWKYLEIIFTYAGTLSLSKELKSIEVSEIQIGDVFIQGGSPGHAVIVVDMAENNAGEKVFLLAQSYMPAQEIQILKNPNDEDMSPWYSEKIWEQLETPQWTFYKNDLKRF